MGGNLNPEFSISTGGVLANPTDTRIVRAAVHPAIGVARVGPSNEFWIGPETIEPVSQPAGFFRDATGALKRQAARFRVYGYNSAGEVVAELTAGAARIEWSVHIANKKAAWYQWALALDVAEAANVAIPLRNASIGKDSRRSLVIDPGEKSIEGASSAGVMLTGEFTGVPVMLGELRTDEAGRLVVLPGRGVSGSPEGKTIFDETLANPFANADGWYDDIADGPVMAAVSIDGHAIPVESAWVISAPPNYAPEVKGVRTLYDLLIDVYQQAGWVPSKPTVSFTDDVHPILRRLSMLQWVNEGFANQFGHGGPHNFQDPVYVDRLRQVPKQGAVDNTRERRWQILNSFRTAAPSDGNQLPWPWLYGDAMDVPAGPSVRQNATISRTQEAVLRRWAKGEFEDDWDARKPAETLANVPISDQPMMLDRAALEFCLADGFHPGCEVTWPIRHLTLFERAFRIRRREPGSAEPDYGNTLTQAAALATGGPVNEQGPGDLTRWMGLPWQADTAYCRAGYDPAYDRFVPSFWPARVPNQVLSPEGYSVAIDTTKPREERIAAFNARNDWFAPIQGAGTADEMGNMVKIFGSMGLVEMRSGPVSDPDLPSKMMVASYGPDAKPKAAAGLLHAAGQGLHDTSANFASAQEAARAPRPVKVTKTPE